MIISNAGNTMTLQTAARRASTPEADGAAEGPKDSVSTSDDKSKGVGESAKKALIASACGMGGLTGGYVMGSMTGALALTRVATLAPYAGAAGYAGAGLGALWGAALYLKNDDAAVSAVVKGSAAGSVGGTLGLIGGAFAGPALSELTGAIGYATNLPLATAISGSLLGFAINRAGEKDTPSDVVKQAAGLSTGATLGWVAGGVAQHLVNNVTGASLSMGGALGAVAGGLAGLSLYLNWDKVSYGNDY